MSPKRQSLIAAAVAFLALGAVIIAPMASGTATALGKPVIGKPVTVPARPMAGKRLVVAFRVTRAGVPLKRGTMICDPSVSGIGIPHAESFKGGTARLSFVVPASAAGKMLRVKLTIRAGLQSATKIATFGIASAPTPALSIADASVAEGNAGTTTLSFAVTLSAAATQVVSATYATADGTAVAPTDYAASSGKVVFQPGEKAKTITVGVVGDTAMEPTETFTVALSSPVNTTIAKGTATGTITNDDTAVPVNAGSYKGSTQNGDYVFLAVTADRTLTGFRINNVSEQCQPAGIGLRGAIDWTENVFPIRSDGSFAAEGHWTGSDRQGDIEWTSWSAQVAGLFASPTSVAGTLTISDELNYKGQHFRCSTGPVKWSAALVG